MKYAGQVQGAISPYKNEEDLVLSNTPFLSEYQQITEMTLSGCKTCSVSVDQITDLVVKRDPESGYLVSYLEDRQGVRYPGVKFAEQYSDKEYLYMIDEEGALVRLPKLSLVNGEYHFTKEIIESVFTKLNLKELEWTGW